MNTINLTANSNYDENKFHFIYSVHYDMVKFICSQYLKGSFDAEDAVQDTFLRVYDKFGQFDAAKGELKSWIAKIAKNTCLMMLRSFKLRQHQLLEPGSANVPTQGIDNYYDQDCLKKLVAGLSPIQERVFTLYEQEGYDHDEIGDMFGIEGSSSRANLCRAKKKLRKACSQMF